ncbi:hypothetical protein F0562_028105 [Nyssa sinensis]|uniref:Uncharacterized protein n=1 Tax=Nyssa sinensis TaxID=561372 RepID=A0A5J5B7I4_9ASTE|nr:hypothetical protein F0562_028105 [Nyssa sinensis]
MFCDPVDSNSKVKTGWLNADLVGAKCGSARATVNAKGCCGCRLGTTSCFCDTAAGDASSDEGSPCFVPFVKAKKGTVLRMSAIRFLEDSDDFEGGAKSHLHVLVGNSDSEVVPKATMNMSGGIQTRDLILEN